MVNKAADNARHGKGPDKPTSSLELGQSYYAEALPDIDTELFAPLWHIYTVGHRLAVECDRVARGLRISSADMHLLGTLRIHDEAPLRATDLARTLHISVAALSIRADRLVKAGLVVRLPVEGDRRSRVLRLTEEGRRVNDEALRRLFADANVVRLLRKLPEADRLALGRTMGLLHDQLYRDFVETNRSR